MVINCIENSPKCTLGENPLWFAHASVFLWTDIVKGCIYAYSDETKKTRTVLESDFQIGAFVICRDHNLILLTEIGLIEAEYSEAAFHLDWSSLIPVELQPDERFNDAIVDCKGRILAGSKRESNTEGKLFCFEAERPYKILLENLSISNGMGFTRDNKTLFHTDSGPGTITAYAYDAEDASISNPVLLYQSTGNATCDGMTVDKEDTIWTSCWAGGKIVQLDLQGNSMQSIEIPAIQCSSLCFGGKNFGKMFVTSATIGLPKHSPMDGKCYIIDIGIQGKAEYEATPHIYPNWESRDKE